MTSLFWKVLPWVVSALLLLGAVFGEVDMTRERLDTKRVIDSLKAKVAAASVTRQTDSVQIIRYVPKLRFDTTRLTDTAYVTEYRERVDTFIQRCLACVQSASLVEKTLRDERDFWQARYNAVKPSKWTVAKPYVFGSLGLYVGQRIGCAR